MYWNAIRDCIADQLIEINQYINKTICNYCLINVLVVDRLCCLLTRVNKLTFITDAAIIKILTFEFFFVYFSEQKHAQNDNFISDIYVQELSEIGCLENI